MKMKKQRHEALSQRRAPTTNTEYQTAMHTVKRAQHTKDNHKYMHTHASANMYSLCIRQCCARESMNKAKRKKKVRIKTHTPKTMIRYISSSAQSDFEMEVCLCMYIYLPMVFVNVLRIHSHIAKSNYSKKIQRNISSVNTAQCHDPRLFSSTEWSRC